MKPKIGDIWLDQNEEHSLITEFFEDSMDGGLTKRKWARLYVLDSYEAKNGNEDYTFIDVDAFGKGKYMHTLVSRIKHDKDD